MSVPYTDTSWSQAISIPQFHIPSGRLDSIDISLTGTADNTVFVESRDLSDSPYSASRTASMGLNGPSGSALLTVAPVFQDLSGTLSPYDGVYDYGGTSGFTTEVVAAASGTVTLTSTADLAPYIGSGSVSLVGNANSSGSLTHSANGGGGMITQARIDVVITYHYHTVPATVPTDLTPDPPLGFLPDAFTLPTWMEGTVPSDVSDAPGGGPASAISVSLVHGVADVDEGPDLTLDNPTGPSVVFERRYRSALAAADLSSPGLPRGWTHNWDYRIVPLQQGAWGPLKLVYPNGASETLTPVLSNGVPTGKFTAPSGAPYVATGDTNTAPNFTWADIVLTENGYDAQVFVMPTRDSVYRLSTQRFENGSYAYLSYTGGKLTSLTNGNSGASALDLELTYGGSSGMLSLANDAVSGKSRGYTYASGGLTGVSNVGNTGGDWAYSYTSVGGAPYLNTVATSDPHGNAATATIAYDAGTGRASSVTDAKGDARSFAYSDSGAATVSVTGATGVPDGYTAGWDASKRQTSITNAAGDTTTYGYDTVDPSQVVRVAPPLGSPTTVQTDSHGNPTRVTYPYGNYDTYTWEYSTIAPLGRVTSVYQYGTNGVSKGYTRYSYFAVNDPSGRYGYLKSVTRPNGGVWGYSYTNLGSVAAVAGPNSTTSYGYTQSGVAERYGKPLSVSNGVNPSAKLQYDTAGRVTGVQDPLGNVSSASYNGYDQPLSVQMPLQHTLQIVYAAAGKAPTASAIAVGGNSLTLEQATYDKESGLAASTDANNLTTSVARDGQFDLQSVKNGANQTMHGFTPDPVHRAGQATMGTGSRSLALNATMNTNGDLTSVAGSDNRTTSVYRNSQGDPSLITSLRWQDTAGHKNRQDFKYDAYGRVVEIDMDYQTDSNGDYPTYTRLFTYDAEDHLLSAGVSGGTQTEYTYDLDGMRNAMYVAVGAGTKSYVKYAYGYDGARRMTSVVATFADNSHNVTGGTLASAAYTYDADGRVIAVRTPKATTVYAYDALGQLTGLQNLTPDGTVDPNAPSAAQVTDPYNGTSHSILSSFSNFTYDLRGDRTGMSFSAMSYVSGAASYGSGSTAWGYDAAGRLTSEAWSGVVSFGSGYTYDGGDNLTSLRGTGLSIDAASDQLTAYPFNGAGLSFDARNYATFVGGTSTYNTNETYAYAPSYDEAGRRRSQTLDTYRQGLHNTYTDAFVYDGDALVYRTNTPNTGNGAYKTSDLSTTDRSVLYLWGPTGPAMEFDLSGDSKSFTFDPEGSCLSTTDGQVVQPVFFDAYGEPINSYSGDDRFRQQPFQYEGQAGYYWDGYSGLCYCLHRYYDPRVGRWTQRDPVGLEGGVNVYAYCGGNPVMSVDPSGLQQKHQKAVIVVAGNTSKPAYFMHPAMAYMIWQLRRGGARVATYDEPVADDITKALPSRYDDVLWWGHGWDGQLQYGSGSGEFFTYEDIHEIALTRKKKGLPKIKIFRVMACDVMNDRRMVNALLETSDRVDGYEG